jgi:hypothetical protein
MHEDLVIWQPTLRVRRGICMLEYAPLTRRSRPRERITPNVSFSRGSLDRLVAAIQRDAQRAV